MLLVHHPFVAAPALTDNKSRQQIAQHSYEEAIHKLRALAKELIPPTVTVSFLVSESHLQTALNKLLAEPFDHLIFTGIKRTGLLRQIFLGSVAIDVIENTESIIVAMPKEIAAFSHERIFVALTEKYPLDISELNRFLNFIDSNNTLITFFYLAQPNETTTGVKKQLADLSNLFADRFNTNTAIYEGNNPFEDIKNVINNKEEEMLVAQKGSRLLSDQLFRRFLINELVYKGQTPLIILP